MINCEWFFPPQIDDIVKQMWRYANIRFSMQKIIM